VINKGPGHLTIDPAGCLTMNPKKGGHDAGEILAAAQDPRRDWLSNPYTPTPQLVNPNLSAQRTSSTTTIHCPCSKSHPFSRNNRDFDETYSLFLTLCR